MLRKQDRPPEKILCILCIDVNQKSMDRQDGQDNQDETLLHGGCSGMQASRFLKKSCASCASMLINDLATLDAETERRGPNFVTSV